ncbi:phosphotransferase family protein [Longimicrobium sp.]|uniref:phosphotransferase family protein n=1 Tax=Longimicrobium sp. TaxID=2029185 RepID=UPI002E30DF03|nr:phosphotransferase [Longimicrobium sp.]HEX6041541.1 phosphotransferase [Longimicrobium sp.]
MILSPRTLTPYLLDRGLITPAEVVDGDLWIADISRRNRNFRVRRGTGRPGLFIKQPQDWEPYSAETLRREATCYLLARDDADFAALGELLPRFVDYDAQRAVLALELLPSDESLADHHQRHGSFPTDVAERVGTMLGSYHRHAGSQARDAGRASAFPRGIPWILNVTHHHPGHVRSVSAGNQELVRILTRYPEYGQALDGIMAGWRRDALIHGDLKWENCMVLPPETEGGPPGMRIVDWEMADFGDPCWDVGSIFQAYLCFWILSIQAADTAPPESLPSLATVPLERMQPALRAFWDAYARTLGADEAEAADRLRRSALYTAARMLQTAWEHTAYVPVVNANILCIMQVAMNILLRPDEAVRTLLGISRTVPA